jgi:hypothetical protein
MKSSAFRMMAMACTLGVAAVASANSDMPFSDDFEAYSNTVVAADGSGTNGWTGVASTGAVAYVVAETPPMPGCGYPLSTNTHTHAQVMQFEGTITNTFNADTNSQLVYIDTMLKPSHVDFLPTMDPDVQIGAFVGTNKHLYIWRSNYTSDWVWVPGHWTEITNSLNIESDAWVRVSFAIDYLSSRTNSEYPGLNEHYFQVRVNSGEPISDPWAFKNVNPTNLDVMDDVGGTWFMCADSPGQGSNTINHAYFSSLGLQGVGRVDDVVVSTNAPVFEGGATFYTITATAGSGGIIDPAGSVPVGSGSNMTFTITPNPQYGIRDVVVNSNSIGATNTYTFVNVTSNQTIDAQFKTPLEIFVESNGGDANADNDHDGLTVEQEFYAGTSPTNSESTFRVVSQRVASLSNVVTWVAGPTGTVNGFYIYRSTNLLATDGGWAYYTNVSPRSPDGTNVWIDPLPPTNRAFYMPVIPTNWP